MNKTKVLETSLVLSTGFVALYLLFKKPVFIFLAFAFGLIGIFIPQVARYIAIVWFKIADIMNFVMSKIMLGIVYYLILVPIAFIYKGFGKDKLVLKQNENSNWILRNKKYSASDIENIW